MSADNHIESFEQSAISSIDSNAANLLCTYLEENRYICVRQLLMHETSSLVEAVEQTLGADGAANEPVSRLQHLQLLTLPLLELIKIGCYWAVPVHLSSLIGVVEQVACSPKGRFGSERLALYPALLLTYAGGLAAIAAKRYDTLSALLTQVLVINSNISEDRPLAQVLYSAAVIDDVLARALLGQPSHYTPSSAYLFSTLREPMRDLLPRDSRYLDCFDRFEVLLSLVHADLREQEGQGWWAPRGCFNWRRSTKPIWNVLDAEVNEFEDAWPPLKAGLFMGSADRFRKVKNSVNEIFSRSAYTWW